jgi:hypothetical protein
LMNYFNVWCLFQKSQQLLHEIIIHHFGLKMS